MCHNTRVKRDPDNSKETCIESIDLMCLSNATHMAKHIYHNTYAKRDPDNSKETTSRGVLGSIPQETKRTKRVLKREKNRDSRAGQA